MTTSRSYDYLNGLISMTNNATVPSGAQMGLTFTYDSKSRRISKSVNVGGTVSTVNFIYDGWNLLATLNTSSAVLTSFMWGTDLSGTMQGAGGVGGLLFLNEPSVQADFVAYDGNGNVSSLVKATDGTLSANYEYGPFDQLIRASGPMAKLNPFRFSTKYQDDESDLVYYGYRYLNTSMGRWLSRDPIAENGGLNLYCFLGNSSTGQADQLGLEQIQIWASAYIPSAWFIYLSISRRS